MKNLIQFVLFCSILLTNNCFAQNPTVVYGYDNAGNRIARVTVVPPNSPLANDEANNTENETQDSLTLGTSEDELEISVYPNPTDDKVNINTSLENDFTLIISDAQGKKLMEKELNKSHQVVSMKLFDSGVYYFRISFNGEESRNYPIIKQ